MASPEWLGGAAAIAQVDRLTPANVENTDTFSAILTDEDGSTTETVSFNATAGTVANVTAGLTAAINALYTGLTSSTTLFRFVQATDNTTSADVTSREAGRPFYLTSSTTDHGGANTQTLLRSSVTANSGPLDWNTALNWSGSAVPVNSDLVLISGRAQNNISYGLAKTSLTLAQLVIDQAFVFSVGTVKYALKLSACTLLRVGDPPEDRSNPGGSACLNIDVGSSQSTILVTNTRNGGTSGRPPLMVTGTNAANRISVAAGIVGFGVATEGQAGTLLTAIVTGGQLMVGQGCTYNTASAEFDCAGGTLILNTPSGATGAITKVKCSKGKTVINGQGTAAILDMRGGDCLYNARPSSGAAIASLLLNSATSVLDFRNDPRGVTITATTKNTTSWKIYAINSTQVTHTDSAIIYSDGAVGAMANSAT